MKKSNTKSKEGKVIPFGCDVLIVEDEPSYLISIGMMIRSRFPNLRVRSAKDGIEGLKKAKTFKPRIVWTCVRMPRMDGLEMIELIRQNPVHAGNPRSARSGRPALATAARQDQRAESHHRGPDLHHG